MDFEGPFYEQTRQHILTIVRLNIEGTLEMTHAIMGYRDPTLPFRIINVASLAAFYPMPVKATYAASKRFLMDFSLALGNELREMGASVTVLCPAGMPTTRRCVRAIDAQGILGQLTTQNTGSVANLTLECRPERRSRVHPRKAEPVHPVGRQPGAHRLGGQFDRQPLEVGPSQAGDPHARLVLK